MRASIVLAALSLAGPVHAQERDRQGAGAWYGWQIAISDAASGGLIYWGIRANRAAPLYSGLSAFLVVPPVIHGIHDRSDGGGPVLASFGMRLLVPTFMVLAEASGRNESAGTSADLEAEDQPQPSYGLMVIVSAIDVFAWSIPALWIPERREPSTPTLRPRVTLHRDRALLSTSVAF